MEVMGSVSMNNKKGKYTPTKIPTALESKSLQKPLCHSTWKKRHTQKGDQAAKIENLFRKGFL